MNGGLKTRQKKSVLWSKMSEIWGVSNSANRRAAHRCMGCPLSRDQTISKLDKKVYEKSNLWISGVQYLDAIQLTNHLAIRHV